MKKTLLCTLLLIGLLSVSTLAHKAKNDTECNPEEDNKDQCGLNKQCVKTIDNKFHCTCKAGYALNGQFCKDKDECKEGTARVKCEKKGGICENLEGSYECKCPRGFEMHPKKQICKDKDECEQLKICAEQAICHNTRGSFRCTCKKGYVGDGMECVEDITVKQEKNIHLIIIIAGAAGGILFIVALLALCYCVRKRRREAAKKGENIHIYESIGSFVIALLPMKRNRESTQN